MYQKILIANRGAIACRIIRTLDRLGIKSVAVYSEADRHSLHVAQATESILIGESPANQSYLSTERILAAAMQTGAEAIHPGYGFLSERPEFAEACDASGIAFIGPTAEQMRSFALKHSAREMAAKLNVPLLPGSGLVQTIEGAVETANEIGYPLMLKSTAGGGGIGIRLCKDDDELVANFDAVQRLGSNNFGDGGAFLERFIEQARHIEVQIFGDGKGNIIALGERDCSTQRRNQKVIEETPAPGITDETRQQLLKSACKIGEAVNYRNAGTVEFIYDQQSGRFYFLEVNARLQVEHGITEEINGIDLVEWMVRLSSGDLPPLETLKPTSIGSSIEARLYAEDAGANFQPSSGRLTHVSFPDNVRVEHWLEPGVEITPYYDPMLAKLIVTADNRENAITALQSALDQTYLAGIETNLDYLRKVCASKEFTDGSITTSYLSRFEYVRSAIEVIQGGAQTTVQDYPGRLGYWNIGVPPSGPMDSLTFRLLNRLIGNQESAAGLECTFSGPELKFGIDTVLAIGGADMNVLLDGKPIPYWTPVSVKSGSILKLSGAEKTGMRAYIAIAGGIDVGEYLGSRSTFMLGAFGGHAGRALRTGDVIHLANPHQNQKVLHDSLLIDVTPTYTNTWEIAVLYGPHGAPDFFLDEDIATLLSTDWKVHHQLDRTGVRLVGPRPKWARLDGGDAGLHPSNIHDNAYAIGAIDFTGDMPIILGPDGPSLGGFVCPVVIVEADLWKAGQLRPGDSVRFRCVTHQQATEMETQLELAIQTLSSPLPSIPQDAGMPNERVILAEKPSTDSTPMVVTRADGDRYLLVEFGPLVLDLGLRLRVHALEANLRELNISGIVDITPGVRSLHVHYDSRVLSREVLLDALKQAELAIPDNKDIRVPSRIIRLPMSWNDPQTQLAMRRYMETVKPDAPWCPDNIEFIRRINGLDDIEQVRQIFFDASYLVLGLGDVYLGAPVATPLDPRHRLVTTKYNPARTWTPENAVGIGGAYLCIYGMESPGGYQLCGRTIQIWNTYKTTDVFQAGSPWLLRFFDQLQFYPVDAHDLMTMRDDFPHGKFSIEIENTELVYADHLAFLESIKSEASKFKGIQQAAFSDERERWAAVGLMAPSIEEEIGENFGFEDGIPESCEAISSPLASSVWKILVEPGQSVERGETLIVLEAMKSEILVTSTVAGVIEEVRVRANALVSPGQELVILRRA